MDSRTGFGSLAAISPAKSARLVRHPCGLCDPGLRRRRQAGDRLHPAPPSVLGEAAWAKLVELGRTLGKPLVMRMNLNRQSTGEAWTWHKNLMRTLSPIVDCGVHYVDIMCLISGARPVKVHAMGARLSDEIGPRLVQLRPAPGEHCRRTAAQQGSGRGDLLGSGLPLERTRFGRSGPSAFSKIARDRL